MAVLVDLLVPGAAPEQLYAVEARIQARGEETGRHPWVGCMFLAVTPGGAGFRLVSVWRSETDFQKVLHDMLGPDLAEVGLSAADIAISPVASMAIPG